MTLGMCIRSVFTISAIVLVAIVVGGCSKSQSVTIGMGADMGTNLTAVF